MLVSVIVCTYSTRFLKYLDTAVMSLAMQTHRDIEIIVVVDGDRELQKKIESKFLEKWRNAGPKRRILVSGHPKNMGLSHSRNEGIKLAKGDIIAFMDDDAAADREWISKLLEIYEHHDVPSVGGEMLPIWEVDDPGYVPEEFYWLIGVTHKGFPEDGTEVRNTFGSNMSFRKEVFQKIGAFDVRLGRVGNRLLQGEETELCMRMREAFGKGVYFTKKAVVHHHIFAERVKLSTLFKRSYEHGISKSHLRKIAAERNYPSESDDDYIRKILSSTLPEYLRGTFSFKPNALKKLVFVLCSVTLVGMGYGTHKLFGK